MAGLADERVSKHEKLKSWADITNKQRSQKGLPGGGRELAGGSAPRDGQVLDLMLGVEN